MDGGNDRAETTSGKKHFGGGDQFNRDGDDDFNPADTGDVGTTVAIRKTAGGISAVVKAAGRGRADGGVAQTGGGVFTDAATICGDGRTKVLSAVGLMGGRTTDGGEVGTDSEGDGKFNATIGLAEDFGTLGVEDDVAVNVVSGGTEGQIQPRLGGSRYTGSFTN